MAASAATAARAIPATLALRPLHRAGKRTLIITSFLPCLLHLLESIFTHCLWRVLTINRSVQVATILPRLKYLKLAF